MTQFASSFSSVTNLQVYTLFCDNASGEAPHVLKAHITPPPLASCGERSRNANTMQMPLKTRNQQFSRFPAINSRLTDSVANTGYQLVLLIQDLEKSKYSDILEVVEQRLPVTLHLD